MSSTIEPKSATPTMPVRPEIAEPVEVAEKPRRRRWIWIVVATVAVLAVVGAYVFVNVTSSTILDENFNGGSGTFPTETTANLETAYVNEAYQVTVTTPPASPAYPYVQLNDSVDAMNLQADVSIPADAPAGTYAGVMAMTSTSQGYMLAVGVDGSVVLIKALNLESSDRNAWFQLPPMISLPVSGIEQISLWTIVGVSFVGGIFSGFLGGGAGYIRMPALVYLLGVPGRALPFTMYRAWKVPTGTPTTGNAS